MGGAYPELHEQRDAIEKWLATEEESFGRTLEQGTRQLEELIERAHAAVRRGSPRATPSRCTTPTASRST